MRIRYLAAPEVTGWTDSFNMHGLGEVIVTYDGGDASSEEIRELEVYLETQDRWAPMRDAFRAHDLITDNQDRRFFEPPTAEDRERGHTRG